MKCESVTCYENETSKLNLYMHSEMPGTWKFLLQAWNLILKPLGIFINTASPLSLTLMP